MKNRSRTLSPQARYNREAILSRTWLRDNLPEVFAQIVASVPKTRVRLRKIYKQRKVISNGQAA